MYKEFAKRCDNVLEMKDKEDSFKMFYKSLPIIIINAIFSIGVRYGSVINVIEKYIKKFNLEISKDKVHKNEHTINDFLKNMEKYDSVENFAKDCLNMHRTSSVNGILKAEACRDMALLLKKHGINTLNDWECYESKNEIDKKILLIKGQSSGIMLKYFYMLTGDDSVLKPDRHIQKFINNIIPEIKTHDEMLNLLEKTVEILKNKYPQLTIRLLDNLIWNYQRKR